MRTRNPSSGIRNPRRRRGSDIPLAAGATDERGVLGAARRAAETTPNEEGATACGLHGAMRATLQLTRTVRPHAGRQSLKDSALGEAEGAVFK